jgi:hypothetical protein
MKKIISFSLYGNKPNYQVGAILNVIEAASLYPDFLCRVYTTDTISVRRHLQYLAAAVIDVSDWPDGFMFWRFLAVDDCDVCLVRDCDSIVNERELQAVNNWLESGKQWHIMRDHKGHRSVPILGGMWGYRKLDNAKIDFTKKSIKQYIQEWLSEDSKRNTAKRQYDQYFLRWFYDKHISGFDIKRHGWQGEGFPDHKPMRYSHHVGSRDFPNKKTWNPIKERK